MYKEVIQEFFPRKGRSLSIYECFNQVKVEHYFKTLFAGEKKYGRVIFIEEMANG